MDGSNPGLSHRTFEFRVHCDVKSWTKWHTRAEKQVWKSAVPLAAPAVDQSMLKCPTLICLNKHVFSQIYKRFFFFFFFFWIVSLFRKTAQLEVATPTSASNHLLYIDDVISSLSHFGFETCLCNQERSYLVVFIFRGCCAKFRLMLRSLVSTFHIGKVETAHRHAYLLIGAKKLSKTGWFFFWIFVYRQVHVDTGSCRC